MRFAWVLFLLFTSLTLIASPQFAVGQTLSGDSTNASLPQARFVFSTRYSAGTVAGFVVDPTTGVLNSTGQTPVWAHWGPTRIAANVGATQLFVANQGSLDVSAYTINRSTGYLTGAPGVNFPVGGVSTDIAVHPNNKFVYVTTANSWDGVSGGQNSISAFSIESNGALKPVAGSPFVTSANNIALAIHPNGKFLYVSTWATKTGGAVAVYSINETTGAITLVKSYPIVPAKCNNCVGDEQFPDLAINPTGAFLLAPGTNNGVIYVYKINSTTGAIANVPGSPFIDMEPCGAGCPGAGSYSLTVDAKNRYVYVQNQLLGELTDYKFNATTGALTMLPPTLPPYRTFFLAPVIRADPSGSFVYLLGVDEGKNPPEGAIDGLVINPSNGSLTQVQNAPYPNPGLYGPPVDGIVVTP